MSPEAKSNFVYTTETTADEAFYDLFPKEKLERIEALGDTLLSPFEIMARFGALFSRKKSKRAFVLAKLSQTDYGNRIDFVERKGKTRVFARNAEPLMRALHSVYLTQEIMDCFPDSLKEKLATI